MAGGNSFWPHFHFIITNKENTMVYAIKAAAKWLDNYMLYMRTVSELNALSDQELKDLNMSREEIIFEAAKHWVARAN